MKWNWGKGIVVAMACFMGFILYMVITMSTDDNYSHDLVTEEYYAKEMAYQTEIDAETNARNLVGKISGKRTPEGWLLTFPSSISESTNKGTVFLYRPSNQQLDFEVPMAISGSNLLIPDNQLIDGRWNIIIAWTDGEEEYMYKKSIVY
ncbi:cytochrome C oxidase Cbb3 [Dokdonia sp. Dokd-P16]|uniref:FixH family protein n=1 Tax=Dokdonia sp. Dokd-P16 TaxID=2173169 RepID=UPI000D548194|nr:FixH family protein [Dokdonia sp. Dokd-P16]AWH75563.1 cytochrome C oxidase Cbb3 [Dokdonia sp. Dokd-P16]